MASVGKQTAKIVFSGIQPTGVPQLGNYLGTIKNWVTLQQDTNTQRYYSIVDLHAMTVPRDPQKLQKDTLEMAASLLACGIDPQQSVLFRQSAVPQHTQLNWVLATITPMGWLNRMTQWKSKFQQQSGSADVVNSVHSPVAQGLLTGLFTYPVLMAADILLFRASHVPVGEDQVQHLELARDLAMHFNKTFNTDILPMPGYLLTATKRVMSLRDPLRKMSKSDPNEQARITLDDTDDWIRKKIKKAPTDAVPGISFDPKNRPGVSNLLAIYAAIKEIDPEQAAGEMQMLGNAQMKELVAQAVVDEVAPIRRRMQKLMADPLYIESVLRSGEEKARAAAEDNWRRIARCVGLPA
ncbi:Tryptophan--tRNA ligase, mitochondrial [Coemansia sp. RSA 1722]|nr:Tryptophan--tRNA ligase, mitochondrial [Coemansia sp. RSA 485]KAJ2603527.1 Tryptophan--tRNA ligase, mitochondrial [Coemansia sp. RSA 1721]KAJ2605303.1 Tryptophan--tRNA ligase, mitochondrial [Coemansia sp. RSA 1722]KAJ2638677.1 Tryptophan--tRNA ligase, mitochondrial [Coemansia sp. RSA 1286]